MSQLVHDLGFALHRVHEQRHGELLWDLHGECCGGVGGEARLLGQRTTRACSFLTHARSHPHSQPSNWNQVVDCFSCTAGANNLNATGIDNVKASLTNLAKSCTDAGSPVGTIAPLTLRYVASARPSLTPPQLDDNQPLLGADRADADGGRLPKHAQHEHERRSRTRGRYPNCTPVHERWRRQRQRTATRELQARLVGRGRGRALPRGRVRRRARLDARDAVNSKSNCIGLSLVLLVMTSSSHCLCGLSRVPRCAAVINGPAEAQNSVCGAVAFGRGRGCGRAVARSAAGGQGCQE